MQYPNRLRRFARILIFGNVAVVVMLALTVVLALQSSHQVYEGRAQQAAENLAHTLALEIGAEIRQIDNALLSTTEQLNRLEDMGRLTSLVTENLVNEQKAHLTLSDSLRVTDEYGLVLNNETPTPVSMADRDYFVQARDNPKRLVISDPLQGRITQRWGIVLARARYSTDGSFRGVVYSNLTSNRLVNVLDDFSLGPQGAVSLRSDTLKLIARYSAADRNPVPGAGIGTSNISGEFKATYASNFEHGFYVTRTALDGIERASAYQRVPGLPLLVLVGIGTDDFYAPWRREALRLGGLVALLALAVAGLSLLFYKRQLNYFQAQEDIARLAVEREALLQSGLVGMVKVKARISIWHNQALSDIFGYGPGEMLGQPTRILYRDEASYAQIGQAYSQFNSAGQYRAQIQMQRKDGSLIWIDISGAPMTNGESLWMMVDITAVKESEQRHRALVEEQSELVSLAHEDGTLVYVNPAYGRHFHLTPGSLIGKNLFDFINPEDQVAVRAQIANVFATGEVLRGENRMVETDGREIWIAWTNSIQVSSDGQRQLHSVGRDITSQRSEQKRLLDLSESDALTGLRNRSGFTRFLDAASADGGAAHLALLYIDLDHFKPVNDSHGHAVGDEVLRQFAQRMLKLVRPTDAVVRLGGDEFAIVLSHVREYAHAERVADKVVEAAATPFVCGELQVQIGASVGIALGADDASGWRGLMERADTQVYVAKAAGRGQRA